MNHAIFIAKKNILKNLMKNVSALYGGDDSLWLDSCYTETLFKYKDNIDFAIECFEDLKKQAEVINAT